MMNKCKHTIIHKIITFFCLLIIPILALSSCSLPKTQTFTSLEYFDTVSTVTIPIGKESTAEEIFAIAAELDALLDARDESSDVYKINNNDDYVSVDVRTTRLVRLSTMYSELTSGMFDISIAPVSLLWDFTGEPAVPPPNEIEQRLKAVGYNNIEMSGESIRLTNGGAIDLGAVAKGFALDEVQQLVECENILVNFGGSVYARGVKPDGSKWRVGIRDPFNKNEYAATFEVSDTCIVTSGIYERSFELDGRLYHHILDTKTGYPAETDVASATIIYKAGAIADIYSTICVLVGSSEALRMVSEVEGMDCVLVLTDGTIMRR